MSTGGIVINGFQNTKVKKNVTADEFLDSGEAKRGGLCCFCCCDYRGAVIIMMIVSIISAISSLCTYTSQFDGVYDVVDDDGVEKSLEDAFDEYNRVSLVLLVISLITYVSALAGAILYNKFMVAVYVVWIIINYVIYAIYINKTFNIASDLTKDNGFDDASKSLRVTSVLNQVFGVLGTILWVYPAVKLCLELHSGVMSTQTYPREKASCCCV